MKIPLTYNGPFPEVTVDTGSGQPPVTVQRGQAAELPKATADLLLAQDPSAWTQKEPNQPKKGKIES